MANVDGTVQYVLCKLLQWWNVLWWICI